MGSGELEFEWDIEAGDWAAVVMNADGSPGIVADITVGLRSGALLVTGLVVLALGALLALAAVAIILVAVRGSKPREDAPAETANAVAAAASPIEKLNGCLRCAHDVRPHRTRR